ncbi:cobalamin biosynthesis protein CobQ [Algimonas porphyrae]|uniref:Phospholipase C/D domain-containing protein n=1 Tax=Algimonas porphyrae TaxID=1128113 RepID=A0ABQ5V2S3_9PROT|nr:hypothetical protein [Algimonas porphyrae]GLQ21796.1 hypothetical protein GCM10007854_27510 [Algimonas porphyrae]
MNTPTHALVALACLSRRDAKIRNRWVLAGALLPDAVIFLWAPWQHWIVGRDWSAIWNQHYFEAPMQTGIALFNSVPIFALLLIFGLWQRHRYWGLYLAVFAGAALLHIALDAPVHGHDAYRHFWPLSDWRFYSPVSYWDINLHARWVSLVEAAIVMACTAILWRRFKALWTRLVLSVLLGLTLLGALLQQLAPLFASG